MRTLRYLPAFALALALAFAPASGFLPAATAAHGGGHGDAHGASGAAPATSDAIYTAKGMVVGMDGNAGTITIRHEPVPAVRWPAMTMSFRLEEPSVAEGVKQGDAVRFDFRNDGPAPTIVHIEPLD
jgi:Cu(I)/Ag(I) efflux system membrane fusion protein